jgi:macrolide transport system ATP-binding/permease protein
MNSFFRKLSWLPKRRRKEEELREELQFHLDEEAGQSQARGLAEQQAQWAARRELGNVTLVQENTRSAWGWTLVEQLGQDLRYALRTMSASKSFSLLAILTLALGIGANTAIYSFMDTILLRSLPVADPESLAVLNWHHLARGMEGSVIHSGSGSMHDEDHGGTTAGIFPYPAFELLKKSSDSVFSSLFAYYPTREVNLMVKGQAEQSSGEYVSGDYFRGLAVLPAAGREIIPEDDRTGAPPVAVLSFAYSQKRFGDAVSAPGQSILINNIQFTVAGVAPSRFFGVDPAAAPDFYLPLHTNILLAAAHRGINGEAYFNQNFYWIEMMARLRSGVNLAQARAALGPVFHQWVATTASNDQERADLPALAITEGGGGLDNLRRQYSKPLYVLLCMVALILAIACANIANLLLARATARRREIAVRLSMGAGRFRVIRQLLTESLLLASIGGGVGVLLAVWGIRALTLLLANGREDFILHPDLNWHVLAAAVALSMITGLLFGLAPALQSTRVDIMPALKESRAGQSGPSRKGSGHLRRVGLSRALMIMQIAISLLMLVGAGLFVRTLQNLQSIQLGFNREHLLLFQMNARQAGHKDPEIVTFFRNLQKRFSAIPGVRDVAMAHYPMIGYGTWMSDAAPIGKEPLPGSTTHILMTGPGFFTAMQIPVLAGREIDQRDQPGSPPVAVINEVFAKANFGDQNPLGHRISIRREPPFKEMEVVGIARNARYGSLKGDFQPVVYLPFNQGTYVPVEEMTYALRTSGDPLRYVNTVREIVRQADPRVPVTSVKTEAAQVDQIMNQEIVFARLCSAFAILALVISCVGLYGTVSYNVARRTGEIGIRTALGAQRGRLVWMILRDVIVLAAVGLAIGIPTALGTSKLVASFLYRIKPNDPEALAIAVLTLLAAALLAGYLPARRASRIDPMIALRHE